MEPFKEEDLLLYLYKECSKATSDAIHTALEEGSYELEEQRNGKMAAVGLSVVE